MFTMFEPAHRAHFSDEIDAIAALRHRVFVDRLDWVPGDAGRETDAFDAAGPTYLAYTHPEAGTVACVRLLPTLGPNMLRDTFPQLLDGQPAPADPLIFESSRFCVDTERLRAIAPDLVPRVTAGLLAAMVEFGVYRGLKSIVTVTDLRVERIVRQSGWATQRIGAPQRVGSTKAVAIAGQCRRADLDALRAKSGDHAVKLFSPVIAPARFAA